jgi:succinate dehydrogenase / fumarate reductase, cytochrome b subunit
VILVAYLFVHLWTLSTVLDGPESFDKMMILFENPLIRSLELGLVGVVVFHSLNGLRLVCLDFFPDWSQRGLMCAVMIISVIAVLVSIPFFFDFK